MNIRNAATMTCCAVASAQLCLAQTVTGRVMAPGALPAAGAIVTALDANGVGVARIVATETGTYSIRLPRAGSYRIRAIRLGLRPEVSPSFDIAPNETRQIDIVMLAFSVVLDTLSVVDRTDCDLRGADAQTFLLLWERARDALAAARSLVQGRDEIWSVGEFGHVNRDGKNARDDSVIIRQSAAGSEVSASGGAERLIAARYVHRLAGGPATYEAPTPDDLLSDAFMLRHCFSIRGAPSGHRNWIGIGYRPVGDYSWVDIAGAIWLDRETAVLRRIDFRYTHLDVSDEMCGRYPDDGQIACTRTSGIRSSEEPGGYVDYVSLNSGAWLAIDREIRTPIDTLVFVKVPNVTSAPARWMIAPTFRRATISWKVASVMRDGSEVYRDDHANNIVNRAIASRAGRHPSVIAGVATDAAGHPIIGAVVSVIDPERATTTNDSGFFQIDMLPAEHLELRIGCPRHPSASRQVTLRPDSTQHVVFKVQLDGLIPDSASSTHVSCPAR